MRLYVAPENQGQIVEYAFGWHEGDIWMKVYDRSDRSEAYYVLRNPWNGLGKKRSAELDRWEPHQTGAAGWIVKAMKPAMPPVEQ